MGDAAVDTELGNGSTNAAVADAMEEAIHGDATKLTRALIGGGIGQAAAALYLALVRSAPPGLLLRTRLLLCWYYGFLVGVVLLGVAEAWVGFWVSDDPLRRRAIGMTVLQASVLPVVFVAGAGGFAILKK